MKLCYLITITLVIYSCGNSSGKAEYKPIKLKGSESMHETFSALATDFQKQQDTLTILIEGGGSRTGLVAIKNQTADIGLSSFSFNLDEELGAGHNIVDRVVASDGIAIVTNERNPIGQLTDQQISDIYNGRVNNWTELGGNDALIVPIARDSNSGTQRFFESYFNVEEISTEVKIAKENHEIVHSIFENENEIGYIGFAYFNMLVKEIAISSKVDSSFVQPSPSNLEKGIYPLNRSLHIYFQDSDDPRVQAFLIYLNSDRAKKIIEGSGLIANTEPFMAKLVP